MKRKISSFVKKQWLWLLVAGLVLVAVGSLVAGQLQQQVNDAEFTMPVTHNQPADDPMPVQIDKILVPESPDDVDQPGLTADSSTPDETSSSEAPAVVADSEPTMTVEPDPVLQCSNDINGVVIPSLDVSATTVPIGLDENRVLGDPSHADRMAIGVYTAGPMPGEPGNTLINGHTYIDGSSVFDHSFGTDLKVGGSIELVSGNCVYSYEVQRMWPNLAKHHSTASDKQQLFSEVVDREDLFRQTGPSGLVVMTCAGEFDYSVRHHEDEAVAYATLVDISVI